MIEARRQRDRAEFQAKRATASSEFMRYLVTQIGNKPMTMREVLDRGRLALEQQYQNDPAFVARMLIQLSGPYIEAGDVKTAAQMMARALEIALTLGDPDLLATTTLRKRVRPAGGAGLRRRAAAPRGGRKERTACLFTEPQRGMRGGRNPARHSRAQAPGRGPSCEPRGGAARAGWHHDDDALHERARYARPGSQWRGPAAGGARDAPEGHRRQPPASDEARRLASSCRCRTRRPCFAVWGAGSSRTAGSRRQATLASRSGGVPGYLLANHARLLAELRRDDEARAAARSRPCSRRSLAGVRRRRPARGSAPAHRRWRCKRRACDLQHLSEPGTDRAPADTLARHAHPWCADRDEPTDTCRKPALSWIGQSTNPVSPRRSPPRCPNCWNSPRASRWISAISTVPIQRSRQAMQVIPSPVRARGSGRVRGPCASHARNGARREGQRT